MYDGRLSGPRGNTQSSGDEGRMIRRKLGGKKMSDKHGRRVKTKSEGRRAKTVLVSKRKVQVTTDRWWVWMQVRMYVGEVPSGYGP